MNDVSVDFRNKQDKPIASVLPPGAAETERLQIERKLSQAAMPVFPSMERAARAV